MHLKNSKALIKNLFFNLFIISLINSFLCIRSEIELNKSRLESITSSNEDAILSPAFDPLIFSYTMIVPYICREITIYALAKDNNANITFEPNPNIRLIDTGNNVKIKVISNDNLYTTVYKINMKKVSLEINNMKFIESKNDTFTMGNNNASSYEKPEHRVTFTHNFRIDTTEVTQEDYERLMTNVYGTYIIPKWDKNYGIGNNIPAYNINWYEALLYCNARTIASGSKDTVYTYNSITKIEDSGGYKLDSLKFDIKKNGFRLPTEAEWEYACRGKTTTNFFWGNNFNAKYCWYYGNSNENIHEVAKKNSNQYGLYDMCGNVAEWCGDWFFNKYVDTGFVIDPIGPLRDSINLTDKVNRGGNWSNSDINNLSSTARTNGHPEHRLLFVGFRVVQTIND